MSDCDNTKTTRPRSSYGFTPEQFVEAWQTSKSAPEAARKLSQLTGKVVPPAVLHTRASTYRKKGVKLKKMRP